MAISKLNNFFHRNTIISKNDKRIINTGMALLAATGIALGVKCCSNNSNSKVDNLRIETISYDGCRTPQDKLLCCVDFCLGHESPFTSKIIKNADTDELFLELTAKKGAKNKYPVSNIKKNLGLKEQVIGQYNNAQTVASRRNWGDDRATIDAGKSIKIPVRELGKVETSENKNMIYELKQTVIDIFRQKILTFENAKFNFEKTIDKYLENDKNSLKTTLVGKDGNFYARITRTNDNNKTPFMYSMKYIKNRLGLKDGVIKYNNTCDSLNTNICNDSAMLLPQKYIDIPITELGQKKDSKENEYLKKAVFEIDNF